MIPYLLFVATIFAIAYMNFVRPARKHRKAVLAAPVVAAPVLREPRDMSRPFLAGIRQLADPQDERLSICPVCGMADPGNLDGELRGWPAHSECTEWLGDWKPCEAVPFPPNLWNCQALLANGIITPGEFRERLDRDILSAFSVPPPDLG